ncbi:hypothetical protein [Gracilibacillus timonensis]|uniref:hypothetical protein n=1 Tax=Gracilibacillus timonensis TaxID=1816696 RepID=UPI000826718D|nr:hypothetical protein [Gracilibacillus timonensis]
MKQHHVVFAAIGSVMTILFLILVNYLTSPSYIWFIYPAFPLLLWLVSVYLLSKGRYKIFVLVASLLTLLYLSAINYIHTPEHPWILYALWPIMLLVVLTFLGKYSWKLSMAWIGTVLTIVYYSGLNYYLSPGYPWAIYPTYVVLWWPMLVYCIKAKKYFGLSVLATLVTAIFFVMVRVVSSPHVIWEIYPIFAMIWWPLSMYFYGSGRRKHSTIK